MPKGHLRGIGHSVKHRLAIKHFPYADTIQSSDQFVVKIALERMCNAQFMQVAVGFHHLIHDPCAVLVGARRLGAMQHYFAEAGVDAALELALPDGVPQRFADLHLAWSDD